MTKLVMISSSLRSPSTDSALVRAAAPYALIHLEAGDVHVASIRTLPPFDADVERRRPAGRGRAEGADLRRRRRADQYTGVRLRVLGVLKTVIDRLSRRDRESPLTDSRWRPPARHPRSTAPGGSRGICTSCSASSHERWRRARRRPRRSGGTHRPSCPACGQRYPRRALGDPRRPAGRPLGGPAQTPQTLDSRRSS